MFCFAPIRVNDKSRFTFARTVGEFRLYVHPDGPKQKWRLPQSTASEAVTHAVVDRPQRPPLTIGPISNQYGVIA